MTGHPARPRLVITGLGWWSALGPDVSTTWHALCEGVNGIRPIRRFDATRYPAHVAAELCTDPPDGGLPADCDRATLRRGTRAFLAAAREAWEDSGLPLTAGGTRVGVSVGVSANYLHHGLIAELWRWRDASGTRLDLQRALQEANVAPWHHQRRQGQWPAAAAARALGCNGPLFTLDTACASSLHALREACRVLWTGRADAMIVGGASAPVDPLTVVAFGRIGALSPQDDPERASRPFDRQRDGFVLGEGGGAVVVERLDHALARGARAYAEVAAVTTATAATSLTDPSPGGEAEARVMQSALDAAGLGPEAVDYVAAHGTSTPKNDATETAAIRRVFGDWAARLAVSSVKGQLGHTIASAGVFNVLATALAIATARVPPTAHYSTPDPECDLDYVPNLGRRRQVRAALANAFAFGGHHACAALIAAPGPVASLHRQTADARH